MVQLNPILLTLATSLAEVAIASHENDHSTPAFTTLKATPTLSCRSIASMSNSTCATILPGLFPPTDSHWNNTSEIPGSLPPGIAKNTTHHWPGVVSNTSLAHRWPSTPTPPLATARPIKSDLPSKSDAQNCRGYLVSCIAALLTINFLRFSLY